MKFTLSYIAVLFFTQAVFGQNLPEVEKELARLGLNSVQLRTEEERLAASDTFTMLLDKVITSKDAFTYPFDQVQNLSKLISPDNNFRLFTWSVPLRSGSFAYYGRIVLADGGQLKVITLIDNAVDIEKPEFQLLKPDHWYGAVYYGIVKTKEKKTTYYTLLGYRPDNAGHNEKLLEVISEDDLARLRFGAKIFNTQIVNGVKYERPPYRLIFRYNNKVVALVRYIDAEKRIVMDHLAPPDASMLKDWKMYGPDFTYDALNWHDGMWQIEEGIEITGQRQPVQTSPVQQGLPDKR